MEDRITYIINGQPGEWILHSSFISPLGHLMIKMVNEAHGLRMNFNLGPFDKIINGTIGTSGTINK